MQNSDPHNLLIISKSDQLDPDQSLKEAIINDPLLPLHTNLPLLSNQNEFSNEFQSENLLGTGNSLELDVLSHHDLAKQTGTEFTYADTLKQLHLEPNCLPRFTLEENLASLMNSSGSNSVATLSRQQQFGHPLSSPCHKTYITKSALDNRIIYSTISNIANNSIELNNSITLANSAALQQLTDNQSAGQLSTNNGSDLIEMSVNSPTTIYAMSMVGAFLQVNLVSFVGFIKNKSVLSISLWNSGQLNATRKFKILLAESLSLFEISSHI